MTGDGCSAQPQARLATAIAEAASRADPSLPLGAGYELAVSAIAEMRAHPTATAAAIARELLARHPGTDASWASHIARVTVQLIAHS